MKISVVIPCYNAEQFIREAVGSVLSQSHGDLECLVVDDASTDASRSIVTAMAAADKRVIPVFQDRNSGPSVARNAGIKAATGDWITFLDADDLYSEDRIERLVYATNQYPCDLIIDNQSVRTYPDGAHLFSGFTFLPPGKLVAVTPELFFSEDAKLDGYLRPGYMKPMIDRKWLLNTGKLFDPSMRVGEDFLFYANLFMARARCAGLGYDGYIYRQRPASLSRSGFANLRAMAEMTDKFKAANLSRISDNSRRSLERKSAYLKRFADLGEVRLALAGRRPLSALRATLSSPNVAVALIQAIHRRLLKAGRRQV